jgi:hypothetical protein
MPKNAGEKLPTRRSISRPPAPSGKFSVDARGRVTFAWLHALPGPSALKNGPSEQGIWHEAGIKIQACLIIKSILKP